MEELGNQIHINDEWKKVEGAPWPLGATWVEAQEAYNFALYSRFAEEITLLLYTEADTARPVHQYRLDPMINKTGLIWHCLVPKKQLRGATLYAYRVTGPYDREAGHRFDPEKVLLDPFAGSVFFPPDFDRDTAKQPGPTDGKTVLGMLPVPREPFDWPEGPPPRHGHDLIVYELHVKGFTARSNSGVAPENRGTFAGLTEKIPYLTDLGITAVELLPIHQFDPQEGSYWGYMTLNFFSPHGGYAAGNDPTREFKEMVKAFHAAGIEVWLDVVYNHTSEAGDDGPTHSYRGIDNRSYYLMRENGDYINDTGCGNTLSCAHPNVRAMILSSLDYWTVSMGVDGFRFDLASIFARDLSGAVDLENPPLISEIGLMGYLHDRRLVAEAWDINSNLLGQSFPGMQWRQWNGKFRDDIRSFVRGDTGHVGALMQRIYGSDDLFPDGPVEVYRPYQSVNFITAHDGFCLYDLVSYNEKHNQANGHENTDGTDDNRSWNCGWEGDDGVPPEVMDLRRRQIKNFFCLLMLSNGTPMFCAGDEFMNTQQGNNNPYNQDNEITWLDWDLRDKNPDIFRFFKRMIAFRKTHPSIARSRFWREDIQWFGPAGEVDLNDHSHTLAYFLSGAALKQSDLYVMINAYEEDLDFEIQAGEKERWRRIVDTSLPGPDDILQAEAGAPIQDLHYRVKSRSVVILEKPIGKRQTTIPFF